MGALLHDIGMVKVPVEILRAPRSLTSQEFERVKLHTTLGYRIMTENKEFGYLAAHAALEHHERVHPHEAIRYLGASAGRFDQRLVRRLALRMASYPNGTFVRLSTGDSGVVVRQDKRDAERPVIRIIAGGRNRPVEPVEIALADMPEIQVTLVADTIRVDLQRVLEVHRNPGNEARLTREQGASRLAGH